jgi:hypothetical protein
VCFWSINNLFKYKDKYLCRFEIIDGKQQLLLGYNGVWKGSFEFNPLSVEKILVSK